MGSRAQAQQFWCTGLAAPRHVGFSQTRDQTCVPHIGRWIPTHCTIREVLLINLERGVLHFHFVLGISVFVASHGLESWLIVHVANYLTIGKEGVLVTLEEPPVKSSGPQYSD